LWNLVFLLLIIKCSYISRKHKIDEELLTPRRDHIVFPKRVTAQEKQKVRSSEVPSYKQKPPLAKHCKSPTTNYRDISPPDRRPLKRRTILFEEVPSSKERAVRHPNQLGKGEDFSTRKVNKLRENDLSREEAGSASVKKVKKLQKSDLSREQVNGTASLKKVTNLLKNDLSRGEVSGAAVTRSRSPSPQEVAVGNLPSCSGDALHTSLPIPDATVENK
jgi:hypothetical protein